MKIDRRTLLGGGAALAMLPLPLAAAAADNSWAAQFRRAQAGKPWLSAFAGLDQAEVRTPKARLAGKIPAGLAGDLWRNGPARHEVFGARYHHWFDGDGMVQRFRIAADGVSHVGRMVATAKYVAEQAAGRALYPGFGTMVEGGRPVRRPDDLNVANISMVHHGGALYALWEGGSAYQVDPQTLATVGRKVWTDDMDGLPFSAHPRRDADGTLWNFGTASASAAVVLYRIGPNGRLVDRAVLPMDPVPMIHDFMITENYLLLPLPPFTFRSDRTGTFLDRHEWRPDRGNGVLIIDKNDLTRHRRVDLPAHWVFHFGNAWEGTDGSLQFDMVAYDDPSVMTSLFRAVMRGQKASAVSGRPVRVRIAGAATGRPKAAIEPLAEPGISAEFPRIDPRLQGRRNRHVVLLTRRQDGPSHGFLNRVSRFDFEAGAWDTFDYGADVIAEEHILVPHPTAAEETAGWVLGTSFDIAQQRTKLSIFEAARLSAGPVAVATLDYGLPVGLHGMFVPT